MQAVKLRLGYALRVALHDGAGKTEASRSPEDVHGQEHHRDRSALVH